MLFMGVILVIILGLVYVGIFVLMISANWIVYTKAGKPGWASIVPIYNIVVLLEIVGKPLWWVLLTFIPIVNIIIIIMIYHQLSLSFGKDVGFTVGLLFLPFIFLPILAFGDATYNGPTGGEGGGNSPELDQNFS